MKIRARFAGQEKYDEKEVKDEVAGRAWAQSVADQCRQKVEVLFPEGESRVAQDELSEDDYEKLAYACAAQACLSILREGRVGMELEDELGGEDEFTSDVFQDALQSVADELNNKAGRMQDHVDGISVM